MLVSGNRKDFFFPHYLISYSFKQAAATSTSESLGLPVDLFNSLYIASDGRVTHLMHIFC